MTRIRSFLLRLVIYGVFVSLSLVGGRAWSQTSASAVSSERPPLDTLVVLQNAGMFTQFLKCLSKTGLPPRLQQNKALTVLAPRDEAFANLGPGFLNTLLLPEHREKLIQFVSYHVVEEPWPGEITKKPIEVPAISGDVLSLKLKRKVVTLNDRVTILKGDIKTRNGTIHVVSHALVPPGFVLPATAEVTKDDSKKKGKNSSKPSS